LVSTISFSGLERMDYSLAGNNVLKDHRCPILAFFARACPELAEGVGGDVAGATLVRSTPPVVDAVAAPALRKVREGRGTLRCGGFCGVKAGPPAHRTDRSEHHLAALA